MFWEKYKESIAFSKNSVANPKYYVKVPFKEATALVGRRAVFLHKGMAYVPLKELYNISAAHFKAKLMKELIKAYKYYP